MYYGKSGIDNKKYMDQDFEMKVEGHRFVVPIGTVIYGWCEGMFDERLPDDDIPNPPKRIEAVGVDWVVCRYLDSKYGTDPMFARFDNRKQLEDCIEHWMIPQDAGMADNQPEKIDV